MERSEHKKNGLKSFYSGRPPELSINMNQQQFNAHRHFCPQKSYALRLLGQRFSGEHYKGFGEGLLNVSAFIQRHARHEYLTVSDWKTFWREVDTDLYSETIQLEMFKDNNHHRYHDHDLDHQNNHRFYKDWNDRNEQLYLRRVKIRRQVISSESSGNGQNNQNWFEGLHREVERQQLRELKIQREK
ncbi:MAG: hypothetical protein EZS28_001611 [Streblomastix strix]|uniref:Uncharacterized protein n=1 Tax=Streblomastix strix TaxID=222440 RepID=A0A5J4X6Q0_9EUKA|nr:MAG: hypothetical protein EZS28_001611 [Streblomastix strix]